MKSIEILTPFFFFVLTYQVMLLKSLYINFIASMKNGHVDNIINLHDMFIRDTYRYYIVCLNLFYHTTSTLSICNILDEHCCSGKRCLKFDEQDSTDVDVIIWFLMY